MELEVPQIDAFVDIDDTSLLRAIQKDVLELAERGRRVQPRCQPPQEPRQPG